VEPHPGPTSQLAPATGPLAEDLLTLDVTPTTIERYEAAIRKFETWLGDYGIRGTAPLLDAGLDVLVAQVTRYLRHLFANSRGSASEVGHLVSGLRRLIIVARSLGSTLPDHAPYFRSPWRLHRSWQLAVPSEFRSPVPFTLCLAMALETWIIGEWDVALVVLLAFHLLLRPAEALGLRWRDIHLWSELEARRYGCTFGLVAIRQPKTRRMVGHAPHQHVLIEDAGLADLLTWILSCVPLHKQWGKVYQGRSMATFSTSFKRAAASLGAGELHVTPAGLRGGGATDHFLTNRDVDGLRRRGRWTNAKTLERYVQEGAAQAQMRTLGVASQDWIERQAELATLFFQELASVPPPPRHRPGQGRVEAQVRGAAGMASSNDSAPTLIE
jgi:hypothetical protein